MTLTEAIKGMADGAELNGDWRGEHPQEFGVWVVNRADAVRPPYLVTVHHQADPNRTIARNLPDPMMVVGFLQSFGATL